MQWFPIFCCVLKHFLSFPKRLSVWICCGRNVWTMFTQLRFNLRMSKDTDVPQFSTICPSLSTWPWQQMLLWETFKSLTLEVQAQVYKFVLIKGKFQFISTWCVSHKCGYCDSTGCANLALATSVVEIPGNKDTQGKLHKPPTASPLFWSVTEHFLPGNHQHHDLSLCATGCNAFLEPRKNEMCK